MSKKKKTVREEETKAAKKERWRRVKNKFVSSNRRNKERDN